MLTKWDMPRELFSIGFCILGAWATIEEYVFTVQFIRSNLLDEIAGHVFIWSPIILAMGVAVLVWAKRTAKFSLWVLAIWWLLQGLDRGWVVHAVFSMICMGYLLLETFGADTNARSRLRMIALPMVAFLVLVVPLLMSDDIRILFIYAIISVASLGYDWCGESAPRENASVEPRA